MSRSAGDRLRALASEVDSTHRQQRARIGALEGQLADQVRSKTAVEDELEEARYDRDRAEAKAARLEKTVKDLEDMGTAREKELALEVAALRFELAAANKELKAQRLAASGQEDAPAPAVTGSGLDVSAWASGLNLGGDFDDGASDLILEDAFVSAAKRGLSGVVRSVLSPTPNDMRAQSLRKVMGRALVEAASHSPAQVDTVKFLLSQGADVNAARAPEEGGRSALHAAAAKGHKEVVALLLADPGVRLDCLDTHGRTPLHLAARLRKPEAARALLRKGADPDLLTPDGKTALDLAHGAAQQDGQWFALSFKPTMSITQVFESPSVQFWNASALGLRLYKSESWELSHKHFSRAVGLAEKHPQLANARDLSRLYYNRAKLGLRLGEVLQALSDSSAALARDENYLNALEIRAECHLKLFNFERAAADYAKLCESADVDDGREDEWTEARATALKLQRASYYDILGVSRRASSAQIKRAFRTCSIRWHPDKHNKSEDDMHRAQLQFQRINEAREILLDTNRRIIYDSERNRRAQQKRHGKKYLYGFSSDDDDDDDDDDLYSFSENDDDDDVYTGRRPSPGEGNLPKASQQRFPWFNDAQCQPLAEKKASYQARMRELQREQAAREEQARIDAAAKAAADAAATIEAQRSKIKARAAAKDHSAQTSAARAAEPAGASESASGASGSVDDEESDDVCAQHREQQGKEDPAAIDSSLDCSDLDDQDDDAEGEKSLAEDAGNPELTATPAPELDSVSPGEFLLLKNFMKQGLLPNEPPFDRFMDKPDAMDAKVVREALSRAASSSSAPAGFSFMMEALRTFDVSIDSSEEEDDGEDDDNDGSLADAFDQAPSLASGHNEESDEGSSTSEGQQSGEESRTKQETASAASAGGLPQSTFSPGALGSSGKAARRRRRRERQKRPSSAMV